MSAADRGCLACERGWQHCHGTLVEQPDGTWVCSDDDDCGQPREAHEHVEHREEAAAPSDSAG